MPSIRNDSGCIDSDGHIFPTGIIQSRASHLCQATRPVSEQVLIHADDEVEHEQIYDIGCLISGVLYGLPV